MIFVRTLMKIRNLCLVYLLFIFTQIWKRINFVYGDQKETANDTKPEMKEVVLMTADWNMDKLSLKDRSLY